MGVLPSAPSLPHDTADWMVVKSTAAIKETSVFCKALKKFTASLKGYESGSASLLKAARGVIANAHNKERTEAMRNSLRSQLESHVYNPITDYLALYKNIKAEVKELRQKQKKYMKCERLCDKAKAKYVQAEQVRAPDEKRQKLHVACEARKTDHEIAKSTYLSMAPQTWKSCELLLTKRDELQVKLFKAFTISASTLNKVASLKPGISEDSAQLSVAVNACCS